MSQQITEALTFRPASEKLTKDLDGRWVILLNPCDGWHIAHILAFEEDGEVYHVGAYQFAGGEFEPHEFYVAWALLPDSLALDNHFDDQRMSSEIREARWREWLAERAEP
ncbi:hypothetical protein HV192_12010 [Klebsiella oxytoca]|uniref:hypothetical protein n=1 Tax=Klebsiella grimontii TaxID=2058152 RepID=UPI0015E91550|nr:hypothetical protein [Klebsiella grimontii]EGT0063719.1 hypothetical protein [Klebsiella michiganensis]QLU24550.1 hypothetical protein HV192_12010 [Klebsiella oxytoca]MDG9851471.1 hypothetical protein [Klebsiella grimontii]MDG9965630.1 hypothetical protein [Klebsiella grimontii]WDI72481.1 hypothetical protein PU992_12765 [Klebsiella grimontii]